MATGSINMGEIQFRFVGNPHPHPSTVRKIGIEPLIHCGTVGTIAGGFAEGGSPSSFLKRHYRNINSISYLPPRSQPTITLSDSDFSINDPNQDDPIVVTTTIANWRVHKILIDQGSSIDVLYWSTFIKLKIPESAIQAYSEPLLGFTGQKVHFRGFIDLLTTFGRGQSYRTLTVRYILVDADTTYNVLIRQRTLNRLGAVVSTPHMAMKFPATNGEIITIKADPKEARQCYMQSLRVTPYTLRTTVEGQATQTKSVAKSSHQQPNATMLSQYRRLI